jgi:CubicO group peptidase (beta-lactamase class C family)
MPAYSLSQFGFVGAIGSAQTGRTRPVLYGSLVLVALLLFAGAATSATEAPVFPGSHWLKATTGQKAGWSAAGLRKAREYSDSIHSSSVMIIQNGRVVDEWGDVTQKISSFSVRKSLISALFGIYAKEGVIDLNATLAQLGIDDAPDPLTPAERQASIVDLLRARSGIYHQVDFETKAQIAERPARGSHPPGTFWVYNNWDFNALGTIFELKTGHPMGETFYDRIAKPTGMQDFQATDVYYLSGPLSVHRAYHFEISARDLARFGLLYLNHGRWRDRQIVPASWVDKSSHASEMIQFHGIDTGGYEYLWWVEYGGVHFPGAKVPPGTYSARGAGGHFLVVIPSRNLVVVHRFDNDPPSKDVKTVFDSVYKGIGNAEFGPLLQLILDSEKK